MTRYDRYGDPIDDDETQSVDPPHACRDGWLGDDPDGRPIPCLRCRPHLTKQRHT